MKKNLLILVMGLCLILMSAMLAPVPAFAEKTKAGQAKEAIKGKRLLEGIFGGPVKGLDYKTPTISGITNEKGEFKYRLGETVTFSIGGLVLGASPARDLITPAHLAIEVAGDATKLRNQKVTNIARLIQSLDSDSNLENGITITDDAKNTVQKYRYRINFDQPEKAFTQNPDVTALFAELKLPLCTPAQARNHLRRTVMGIMKLTDVRIPTRDGSYLLADVYHPIKEGKYPVLMTLGAYGKAFTFGCVCNQADLVKFEEIEDNYFSGIPPAPSTFTDPKVKGHPVVPHVAEHFERANSVDWVPNGYVVVHVDERGTCNSPGTFEQFSLQEAKDYYDAIEWAGTQKWSNGNVGLWGASYYAMTQYTVAQLQPPHLKAMVPIGGDLNSYRDYIYSGGGLYNPFNFVARNSCGEWKGVDWVPIALTNPFDDPAIYGASGTLCISANPDRITVPFWSAMGTEGTIHTRGSSDAFVQAASKHKKLLILSEPGIHFWSYAKEFFEGYKAFFDYWLKGVKNDIMKEPPVRMMVRTGWTGYYWQYENEWPVARTKYTKYYLDAIPSSFPGNDKRKEFLHLGPGVPASEAKTTYSADVKFGVDSPWSYGVSFATEPLKEDTLIAGYIKAVLWVSSSSHDMQIHAYVRVMDENNQEVSYATGNPGMNRLYPVGQGALKVSHRKLDPARSTVYRPYHTHQKADYQPLISGEIVEAQVELWPTTALIRKGWRIRLDVQPATGEGFMAPLIDPQDNKYQAGASNTIYTGPDHPSYVQLPVVPANLGKQTRARD
jgi:predicted acyl esterase